MPKPNRRAEIVAATEELARTKGLSAVTTRAIAARVGCSEGALYVHFPGRTQLLLAVLEESLPDMLGPLRELEAALGKATPRRNLVKALTAIFHFQERVLPILAALFAEPDLLAAYRRTLLENRKGPRGGIARLERYLEAEQREGRVDLAIDPGIAAETLMAGCFFHAFTSLFFGPGEPFDKFSKKLVGSVLREPKAI